MAIQSTTLALLLPLAVLAAGCASQTAIGKPAELTSAEMSTSNREAGASAEAVTHGAYEHALALADHALMKWPESPWASYDRAVALHHLGRVDAAVEAYRTAERRFGDAGRWGKSLAIYGRARALDDVGRCAEAKGAYEEYATLVEATDAASAEMAHSYADQCRAAARVDEESTTPTAMVARILAHDYVGALAVAKGAPSTSPWVDYNRAVALAELGRTNEAVATFVWAEDRFGDAPENQHGRTSAIYGRARALDQAGRCTEAKQSYDTYASLVRGTDPAAADLALRIAAACKR